MLEAVERGIEHAARAGYTRWERELPVWKGTALLLGPTPVEEVLRWYESEQPRHAIALRQQGILEAMRGRFDEARSWWRPGTLPRRRWGTRSGAPSGGCPPGR